MKQQEKEKEYETYVKEKTPVRKPGPAMAKAFVTGGIICTIGQTILNACEKAGMSKDISASWCSLILILASVVLTGFGIYPKIANWGGAGALVPITGFANSVAAPAIEYKKEGQVFGIGCKIFMISWNFQNGMQDIYDCRTCDPVRSFHQLGSGTALLDWDADRNCVSKEGWT